MHSWCARPFCNRLLPLSVCTHVRTTSSLPLLSPFLPFIVFSLSPLSHHPCLPPSPFLLLFFLRLFSSVIASQMPRNPLSELRFLFLFLHVIVLLLLRSVSLSSLSSSSFSYFSRPSYFVGSASLFHFLSFSLPASPLIQFLLLLVIWYSFLVYLLFLLPWDPFFFLLCPALPPRCPHSLFPASFPLILSHPFLLSCRPPLGS